MSRIGPIARALVAVGGIVAVAVAAASLRSPLEFDGGGGGGGTGDGDGAGGDVFTQPPAEPPERVEIPAFLEYLVYALVLLLAIALVWYLITHRRRVVTLLAVCVLAVAIGAVLIELLAPLVDSQALPSEPSGDLGEGGSSGGGEGDAVPISIDPLVVVLALIAAIFVGGLLLTRDEETVPSIGNEPDAPKPESPEPDATAVGTTAGRAADRLEAGGDVDNEIYRAWREMTALLEVDRPESTTPRQFERAAVEAGIDAEAAETLTRLFETVRYGTVEATPSMEQRATTVFRRVETEYAAADETTDRDDGEAGWSGRLGSGGREP